MDIINERKRNRTGATPSKVSAAAGGGHGILKAMKSAMVYMTRAFGKLALFVIAVGMIVLDPVINFGLGWIGGWVLEICFGQMIADGLNLLFGTTRFTPELIPLACAILAMIGQYFKGSRTSRED